MTEKSTAIAIVEEKTPDNDLINTAYTTLSDIFSKHMGNALMDTGKYLLEEFYDNNIEFARQNKPQKGESLNQLIKRLRGGSGNSPSKSWIYQSISLVVQEHDIKIKLGDDCFQTYGNLLLSHKTSLLSVKDVNEKKTLINRIVEEKLTVRDLGKAKKELIEGDKEADLLTILKSPEKMEDDKNHDKFKAESLKKEPKEKLDKIKIMATQKCQEFVTKLDRYEDKITKHNQYKAEYEKLIAEIDKVIESKEESDGVES